MRLILVLALLAFPVAEIWILVSLIEQYGWLVVLYLLVVGILGMRLIRDEKKVFSGNMMQNLMQGGSPVRAIFGSARNIIAGILLVIPGVMTDVLAAVLLLIPIHHKAPQAAAYRGERAANDDVIEGEFHRED